MSLADKIVQEGYTFDDLLLVPAYSQTLPSEVNIETNLTERIQLQIPIVSAAMDTVSESKLAIALAREGGLSFIHKNMSIKRQAQEIDMVKRSENGMISDPITLCPEQVLQDAEDLMRKYKISGLPVITDDGSLVGILTNRDIRYQTDMQQRVVDVMTKENLVTSDFNTSLEDAKEILLKNRIEKLPIVDKNNKLIFISYRDDISEFEDDFCYHESITYNKKRDISIKEFNIKKYFIFYLYSLEYEKSNLCETEWQLEEEYITNFINNAEITYNPSDINIEALIKDKTPVVSNTRYLGNDYETVINYKLDNKYEEMYIFYKDDLLIIQVGNPDETTKFIAYK